MKTVEASLTQSFGDRITLAGSAGELVYRYGNLPKACIHPLVTPAGVILTGFEMSDHVWHRGLWFTIKFVNGENFWEEGDDTGVQTSAAEPAVRFLDDGSAELSHLLAWTSPKNGEVLRETRSMTFRSQGEVRSIDFSTSLLAHADLMLDRTPYTTWGGYGGLSMRASRELHDAVFELPAGEPVAALTGQSHDWIILRAKVDGGPKREVSMGIIDHPTNPNSPTPWYCKGAGGFTFWNAAFLFHGPMTLAKGKTLDFRFRILYRDGTFAPGEFAKLAAEFRGTK